jgi:hypothetical protein
MHTPRNSVLCETAPEIAELQKEEERVPQVRVSRLCRAGSAAPRAVGRPVSRPWHCWRDSTYKKSKVRSKSCSSAARGKEFDLN